VKKEFGYGIHDRRGRIMTWLRHESIEKGVLDLLRRRPCCAIDVSVSLGIDMPSTQSILKDLRIRDQIETRVVSGEEFCFRKS
jgi:hypothetical protein